MGRRGYVMLGGLPIAAVGVAWVRLYVLHHCTGTKAGVMSTCGLIHSTFQYEKIRVFFVNEPDKENRFVLIFIPAA